MPEETSIRELQKRQKVHDTDHHEDIQSMSYMDRTNHFVLHFSKYVGRLSREYPDELKSEQFEKTLADSFIVCLAAANTLEIDLETYLEDATGLEADTLGEWEEALDPHDTMDDDAQSWLFHQLADPTGRMANALESLDHMEAVPYREILEEGLIEIAMQLILASGRAEHGLSSLVENRWKEIEEDAIL